MELLIKRKYFQEVLWMSAGTEKGPFSLGYGHQIQPRNPIKYFIITREINCNRSLQILASLYLYLVWCLCLIIEESNVILVSRIFVDLKAFLCIEQYSLTSLCRYLIFKFLAFWFFSKSKFFFISRICCRSVKFLNSNIYQPWV